MVSRRVDVRDAEAALLALLGAAAAYAVALDWRVAITAGFGVLVVRVGAAVLLHGTRKIPDGPLPGLTDKESAVASLIHAGLFDPAIAARLGIPLRRIEGRILRIYAKWHISTRDEIAEHVAQIRGEPPERQKSKLKQRWELIAEVGTGVAVMALGLGFVALPPDTPLIGEWREWIGLCLLIGGLLFSAVSIANYSWERAQPKRDT
ncbi:MAG: Bacterial regulatory protein luxR family [Chloroflexota bacterium]|jgi:DNA-binding CsgD family transcriptional regulator|nr:Bacterial regulatory protein luxR family [Chloroflexota bacterium]